MGWSIRYSPLTTSSAESDWLARSTGPGVVWAHDFRTDREVYNFVDFKSAYPGTTPSYALGDAQPDFTDGVAGTGGGCLSLSRPGNVPHVLRSITAIATNRARIVLNEPHDYTATRPDTVVFRHLPTSQWNPGGSGFATLNDWRYGSGGMCVNWKIVNVPDSTSFDIDTDTVMNPGSWLAMGDISGFTPYSGSTSAIFAAQDPNLGETASVYVCSARIAIGDWHRPFSSFVGGTTTGNGRGAGLDDPGIANGSSPSRLWTPVDGTGAVNQSASSDPSWSANADVFVRHAKDFYGYAGYATQLDNWKTYSAHLPQTGMYRGSDFWMQWRQKIPLSRYQLGDAPLRNATLKHLSPWTNYGTPAHEIHQVDNAIPLSKYQQIAWPVSAGGLPQWYTNQNAPSVWVGSQLQSNGTYDATCRMINPQSGTTFPNVASCFHWPPDEWCVVLWHIKVGYGNFGPGSPYGDMSTLWNSWATGNANAAVSTAVQMWVCPQSRIDAARANGVAPTYIAVWNNYGTSGYPLNQAQAAVVEANGAINYDVAGPFFNTFWVNRYQNGIPVFYGYSRKFTQFIFKKGGGGFDPYNDGIACPRY